MPISGPSSYLPTTDEFIAHWNAAVTAFGGVIELRGGVKPVTLNLLRNKLASQITTLTQKLNDREFARGDIETLTRKLLERLDQLNNRVRVLYEPGSRYVNALPKVPSPQSAADKIIAPLDDGANIWSKINAGGSAIVLSGSYDLADFQADLAALKAAHQAFNMAVTEEKLARGARNETQAEIYPILKQYREIIPTFFAADSAIVLTLPRLTPLPGSTPKAVNASGVWDAAENKARLAWDASDSTVLKEYQVRYTPGDKYSEEDAAVVANVLPDEPRTLLTDAGLTQPGAESTFKVFVVTETGNEAGSESLVVERPL